MSDLEVGDFVVVDVEGGKPGQVRYFDRAFGQPLVGVALVNELGRVDEWGPTQVRKVTPTEAGKLALGFVNLAPGPLNELATSALEIFREGAGCAGAEVRVCEGRVQVLIPDPSDFAYAELVGESLRRTGWPVDVRYCG